MSHADSTLHVVVTVTGANFLDAQLSAFARCLPPAAQVHLIDDSRRRSHFSNGHHLNVSAEIQRVASLHGAHYTRLPQWRHLLRRTVFPSSETFTSRLDAARRCAVAVQFGFDSVGLSPDDVLLLIDADMAPIRAFDPTPYLAEADVWYVAQTRENERGRVLYPWNGIFMARAGTFLDADDFTWDVGESLGLRLDVGGECRHWLARHDEHARPMRYLQSERWVWDVERPGLPSELHAFLSFDKTVNGGVNFAELYEETFLHLRAGGNWKSDKRAVYAERTELFVEALRAINGASS